VADIVALHLADPQCLHKNIAPSPRHGVFIFKPTARIACFAAFSQSAAPLCSTHTHTHTQSAAHGGAPEMPRDTGTSMSLVLLVLLVVVCCCLMDICWQLLCLLGSFPLCATNENADRQRAPADDSSNSKSGNSSNGSSNIGSNDSHV